MRNKVNILIDPSHSNWILGGLFKEVSLTDLDFFNTPKEISRLKSLLVLKSVFNVFVLSYKRSPIIFSSITPYQNFHKLNPFNFSLKFLWLTHFETEPDLKIVSLLNKANIIFVHSESMRLHLQNIGVVSKVIPVIGAIDPELFGNLPVPGNKIAWVGTTASRKNLEMFLEFARRNLDLNFKILGKNWKNHYIYKEFEKLKNVEYVEITSKVKYQDFHECSHYLMLSKFEGGPISLLEALASGLIPICTPVGIAPELLTKCGYELQLLENHYSADSIRIKYMNPYSLVHRVQVSNFVKTFSIARLSQTFQNEIIEFLDN